MKKILNTLKQYKPSEFCIISDFDDTLTKGILKNGNRASNSFSVFPNNPQLLGLDYLKLTNTYFKHYYALEQNPNLSKHEKITFMKEWWEKEFDLYKRFKLSTSILQTIITNHLIELRDGVDYFLKLTHNLNIPTLIFSAGIYDLIHGFFKETSSDFSNVHVIGNMFEFDLNGYFLKTKGEIIHSQNKTFEKLSQLPIFSKIKDKKVCILIGDSLGDLQMVENSHFDYILKIGFLNTLPNNANYQERLKAHQKQYDIVIDGREDFSKINTLLKEVFEK
jgi:5'-nucleotidase